MRKVLLVVPMVVLALGLGVWLGQRSSAQDEKPIRVQLPNGWGGLNLPKSQKEKIYEVRRKYKTQILDLEKQIRDLKKKERTEMLAVLTPEQKNRLVEILLGGTTDPEPKGPEPKE